MDELTEKIIKDVLNLKCFNNIDKDTYIRQRYNTNKQILDIIQKEIETHPELRFMQILNNLNIVQDYKYNEEPDITLNNINSKRV